MSICYIPGDIWTTAAVAVVVPVNCRGAAGCGLARDARRRFREWYDSYRSACYSGFLSVGAPVLHTNFAPMLISFPTKDDYRAPSDLSLIEQGLEGLRRLCEHYEIASIAVPKLGCGAGGLRWSQVQPVLVRALSGLVGNVQVYV